MGGSKNSPAETPSEVSVERMKILKEDAREFVQMSQKPEAAEKIKVGLKKVEKRAELRVLRREVELHTQQKPPEVLTKAIDEHETTLPEETAAPGEKPWYESILSPVKSFTDPILEKISKYTGIKGDDMKHMLYQGMSYATALAPAWLLNLIPALNYGRYQLQKLEVEKAIKAAKRQNPSLQATFAEPTTDDSKDLDQFLTANSGMTPAKLAQKCIETKAKAGTTFTFSVYEMLNEKTTVESIANTVASDRKTKVVNGWKATGEIGEVKASDTISAEKNGGKWDVSMPDAEINAGEPTSLQAKKLYEAMQAMKESAKKITIIGSGKPATLDMGYGTVELPFDYPADMSALNEMLPKSDLRIKKIVLGLAKTDPLQANLENGILTISDNGLRNEGLKKITQLYTFMTASNETVFEYHASQAWKGLGKGTKMNKAGTV